MTRRLKWGVPEPPPPKHPYRDTVLVYAGFAIVLVIVAWLTGGGVARAAACRGHLLRRRDRVDDLPLPLEAARAARRRPAMTVTPSIDATVEALCGDLSAIRAPRGSTLNAKSWATEAPLRMLLNNLDSRSRRTARGPRGLRRLGARGALARRAEGNRPRTARARRRRDAARPVRQARRRLPDDDAVAPRVLIANSLLVPRWATWDEFRRLEAEGLTMFGQMTAGSWIYIGTQGILQGTYQTFAAAAQKHFGEPSGNSSRAAVYRRLLRQRIVSWFGKETSRFPPRHRRRWRNGR